MNKLHLQSIDIEWVEQVYQLLMEMARAALSSDIPRLPENISQKAIPLLQKAQSLLDGAQAQPSQESEWIDSVSQLLREVCNLSLAEIPRLPENLAQRCLTLAEKAQLLKEALENETTLVEEDEGPSVLPPDSLLHLLRESVKLHRARSSRPEAPEWQQVLTLVDAAETIYKQIHE